MVLIQFVFYVFFVVIFFFQYGGFLVFVEFVGDFIVFELMGDLEKLFFLLEKKNKYMLVYMQLLEDYLELQFFMFYQMLQNEYIYQQKNKFFMEVYGFSDFFSGVDFVQELVLLFVLFFKQWQLELLVGKDGYFRDFLVVSSIFGKDSRDGSERVLKLLDVLELVQLEEEVDELFFIDYNEIMFRLMFKQEGDDGLDVCGGFGDILLVYVIEIDRKDLVLYCEVFLIIYRIFIFLEEFIKKLQYRYEKFFFFVDMFKKCVSKNIFFVLVWVVDEFCLVELIEEILKLLMELVFCLVCNGELSLVCVFWKNILDKVDQKKLFRCVIFGQFLVVWGVVVRLGILYDFYSYEIVEQLILLDVEFFYKIEIFEVLFWVKEQNEEKSFNLIQFMEYFNNMFYWVWFIIMLQEKVQDREWLFLKFIKIMKYLWKLNNFNFYLVIFFVLDLVFICRLEWQKQILEGLVEYCMLIDSLFFF